MWREHGFGQTRSRGRPPAHEFDHYLLHSQMGSIPIQVRRYASGHVEWKATWFATGFLMTEAEFKALRAEGYNDAELAEHFGVPIAAVVTQKGSRQA